MTNSSSWVSIATLLGGTSVILGAFAAHGLEGKVEPKALEWIKTGSYYQMTHSLALLAWAIWSVVKLRADGSSISHFPAWAFLLGVVIFSGTLYAMAFGAPRWLGAITPIGGTLLILGWLGWSIAAWQSSRSG